MLAADRGEVDVVTCPAAVKEGVESEREVRGGEDDEVEVAEEEGGFSDGGTKAESVRVDVRVDVESDGRGMCSRTVCSCIRPT